MRERERESERVRRIAKKLANYQMPPTSMTTYAYTIERNVYDRDLSAFVMHCVTKASLTLHIIC